MADEGAFIIKVIIAGVVVVGGILVIVLPMSFSSLEYYEYGFARQKSTGKVDTSKVYSQGKHFIGPDYEFKTFRADAHLVNLHRINAFTQDKLEVKISVRYQYFLRKADLHTLHTLFDINYKDIMRSSSVDAIKVKVTASYQYFLRKQSLPLLHKAYDIHYKSVMESSGVDAIKGAVTVFNTREMFGNRSQVETVLWKAVRERLGGICCPVECFDPNGNITKAEEELNRIMGCPTDCVEFSLCTDENKGIFADVRFFQLGNLEIPNEVENRFLKQLTLTEESNREQLLQDAQVVRKETDQKVREVKNEASEISQQATSTAQLLRVKSEANYTTVIETARSKGLQGLFNSLGITEQKHKNSFDYLRTLRGLDNVHMTVDFEQRIAGNL